MVNPFICVGGAFHNQEEDDELGSPCSAAPRKARKSKNPFSDRGLDKFSALLAELEDKRRKIYTQMGSDEISLVRFVYSNTNDCKPIVVRVRGHKQQQKREKSPASNSEISDDKYQVIEASNSGNETQEPINELGDQKTNKKKSYPWWSLMKKAMWRRPSFYLPAVLMLILLFLAVFGRSSAILCTSLGWYLVPAINGGSSSAKRPRKKKEYTRRASEKKISSDGWSSPTSVITGAVSDVSPRQRGHRKSWC